MGIEGKFGIDDALGQLEKWKESQVVKIKFFLVSELGFNKNADITITSQGAHKISEVYVSDRGVMTTFLIRPNSIEIAGTATTADENLSMQVETIREQHRTGLEDYFSNYPVTRPELT